MPSYEKAAVAIQYEQEARRWMLNRGMRYD